MLKKTKKILLALMPALLVLLSGCSSSKQIDVASIAETITVTENNGELEYTFYIIDSSDEVNSTSIAASSLSSACELAKQSYIPNLSLSKFEMFVLDEKIYADVMKDDIEYISSNHSISPLLYVSLCDKNTMEVFAKSKDTPKMAEEHILLLKNKNPEVSINSLSIFNNFATADKKEFYISYINSQTELKAEPYKINMEK